MTLSQSTWVSPNAFRVLIVEDNFDHVSGVQTTFARYSEFAIVGTAMNATEALLMTEECTPDLILMDLRLPKSRAKAKMEDDMHVVYGIRAMRAIRRLEKTRQPRILVLSNTRDDEHPQRILNAVRARISGYLVKDYYTGDKLISPVRQVLNGDPFFGPSSVRRLIQEKFGEINPETYFEPLTPCQEDVLRKLEEGKTNEEIAHDLRLGLEGVKEHVSNLLQKLHAKRRYEFIV